MDRRFSTSVARQATLREHNLAVVARAVVGSPSPVSRADVAAATGLTRATVSALVDKLVEAQIVGELPPAAAQRAGRPAVPLIAAPRSIVGLGLEANVNYLGGLVLDLAGNVIAEHVEPGDFHASSPDDVLGRLGGIARSLAGTVQAGAMTLAGARLALPGLVDARTGRLQVAPNLGWSNVDPVPLLGLSTVADIRVANEAKLAAIAQVDAPSRGPARHTAGTRRASPASQAGGTDPTRPGGPVPTSFLYVSGDVGIGSAIVIDGQLFHGRHGWTGEIGHVVVDPAGPLCPCGARGCLERFAGKDALLRNAGLPPDRDIAQFLRLTADGDPRAAAALDIAAEALGGALADFINLVDIGTVLLGGIFSGFYPQLREPLLGVLCARVLGATWAAPTVRPAPITHFPAMRGGAREVLRDVIDDPSAWLA